MRNLTKYSREPTASINTNHLNHMVTLHVDMYDVTEMTSNTSEDVPSDLQAIQLGLPWNSRIILIILYSITTLLSVIGNLIVIAVFTLGLRSRATNLRVFLINLAVADLIMALFCMPFTFTMTMLGDWIFSAPMCPIVLYMQVVSVTASVCTNMAIGIDRFWVVMYPLKARITKSRSKIVIAIVWIVALSFSSIQLGIGRVVVQNITETLSVRDCKEIWPEYQQSVYRRTYTFFILLSTYIMPLAILSLTYGFVGWKMCRHTTPGNADEARDNQQLKSKRKVIKMLVVVVMLFGICWLPLHVFILVIDFNPQLLVYASQQEQEFFIAVYYSVHWLAMSNSFVNPIIYGFLHNSFRHDLTRLVRLWLPCLIPCFSCLDVTGSEGATTMLRANSYNDSAYNTGTDSFRTSLRHTTKRQLTVRLSGQGYVRCKTELNKL